MSIEAYKLTEGDFFVRGTLDPDEVAAALEEYEYIYDEAPEDEDWEVELLDPRPGLWRFVPCSPKSCGEHGWHLHKAKQTGRGVMEGVYTGAAIRILEFDCDEPEIEGA